MPWHAGSGMSACHGMPTDPRRAPAAHVQTPRCAYLFLQSTVHISKLHCSKWRELATRAPREPTHAIFGMLACQTCHRWHAACARAQPVERRHVGSVGTTYPSAHPIVNLVKQPPLMRTVSFARDPANVCCGGR